MKNNARRKKKASSILITTSHNPSHFLRRVCRLLTYSLPLSTKLNRGSLNKKELLNYCWNNQIKWLFIIKQSQESDATQFDCINLSVSTEPLDIFIELRDFIFPRKGDDQTRISVNHIDFHYSSEIPHNFKEMVKPFKELFLKNKDNLVAPDLIVKFVKYSNNELTGQATFIGKNKHLQLFKFLVLIPLEEL
jgi:hypothetical protein